MKSAKQLYNKRFSIFIIFMLILGVYVNHANADTDLNKVHFLIPGGAGGGWDATARGVGEALTKSKLIKNASYQNMSGGGGGKAIAYLIKTAKRQKQTLMVNFDAFNESTVDFFIYCMTHTTNWEKYHRVKQDVLLKISEIVHRNGAQMAFPTRTLNLDVTPELAGLEISKNRAAREEK